jgi:hypothetical protein
VPRLDPGQTKKIAATHLSERTEEGGGDPLMSGVRLTRLFSIALLANLTVAFQGQNQSVHIIHLTATR